MLKRNHSLLCSIWITRMFLMVWCLCVCFGPLLAQRFVAYHPVAISFEAVIITYYICLIYLLFLIYHLHQFLYNFQHNEQHDHILYHIHHLTLASLGIGFTTLLASYWYAPLLLLSISFVFLTLVFYAMKLVLKTNEECEVPQ